MPSPKDYVFSDNMWLITIVLGGVVVYYNAKYSAEAINICNYTMGDDVGIFIAVALCGSVMVISLSKLIWVICSKVAIKLPWLQLLGRNSLSAFGIHSFWIYLYEYVYYRLTGTKIIHMENFNSVQCALGIAFITVLSIATCYIWDSLHKRIRHVK